MCIHVLRFTEDKGTKNYLWDLFKKKSVDVEGYNEKEAILVRGVRVNNLKGFDIDIPRGKLVAVTGLSGSGKSSLAFDTLYAEGQRRYVESLSSYARQFVGRMRKPEADLIQGIPPAIAIEQKINTRNPRSTVGTSTEIYDYLRLLYARIGKTLSPISGREVKKNQVSDVILATGEYEEGTRFLVCIPIRIHDGQEVSEVLDIYRKVGYSRVLVRDEVLRIEELPEGYSEPLLLVIDRLETSKEEAAWNRLADSVETAFMEGEGECVLRFYVGGKMEERTFSRRFEADGLCFDEPSESMFNFNSGFGACPECEGLGVVTGLSEELIIPDTHLSLYEGAVACWRGEKGWSHQQLFIQTSEKYGFPIHRRYCELSEAERSLLWEGNEEVEGINAYFRLVDKNQRRLDYRIIASHYRGKKVCPSCGGVRLKKEALQVQVGGKHIGELTDLPLWEVQRFFEGLKFTEYEVQVAHRLLSEIKSRLQFLVDVGLGYLTLHRPSNTLSGGESQRIQLAKSLGSSLVGSLYILDEPSIGLHARDTHRLLRALRRLQENGNSVLVVEHDEEIIRAADYIIDIGPGAGQEGGYLVGVFDKELNLLQGDGSCHSHTLSYLRGEVAAAIKLPERRRWNNYIEVSGAYKNNLKHIDVRFPLGVMTVVTGVSGSGKSTLVEDIFYKGVKQLVGNVVQSRIEANEVGGDLHLVHGIEFVSQQSLGRSTRSNPVTYIGTYEHIRHLFASQPLAQQMGYPAALFSFNNEGGRCEECKGEGEIEVEMQFMADLRMECEVCKGKRFRKEILEVTYREVNIYEVLQMTVDEAIAFFSQTKGVEEGKIVRSLQPLQDVGLGYLRLGQTSSSLSGGESQRLKLASFLALDHTLQKIFVFDEPTTGLHFHDIKTLLKAFDALISMGGHTVVVVEHNPDVIKCADHVIDLGPEGGDGGGYLVVSGTPEEVVANPHSYTGKYLRGKFSIPFGES
jgi:excinuclease ABC subunit A